MTSPGAHSTLSTFTASDGDNLAVQDWHLPEGLPPRATVLVVHGLGEHAGRYDGLALRLNSWGFAVRSYDQYGHGESGGLRGGLSQPRRLLDDLADLVESSRSRAPGVPLVLLGHSLGGLVASSFVAHNVLPVDANASCLCPACLRKQITAAQPPADEPDRTRTASDPDSIGPATHPE